jgi:hypothetical protein
MSEQQSKRPSRPRPRWALLALVLAAIGLPALAVAGPLYNIGLCYNSDTGWSLIGRGLANHSATVTLSVDLHCNPVPNASNPCDWCAGYVVEGWAGPIDGWVTVPLGNNPTNPQSVACGVTRSLIISTAFNGTIVPGSYRVRGWLWSGTCDDEIEEDEYTNYPFTVPSP